MFPIELIGVSGERLSPEACKLLEACVLIAHSRRQEALLAGMFPAAERVTVTPLSRLFPALERGLERGPVAVLASGDPLFFGIGRALLERFGADRLRTHPGLSSLQLACARLSLPWDDLAFVSLHGRREREPAARLLSLCLRRGRLLVLTDAENSPEALAGAIVQRLSACGDQERLAHLRLHVAENLGLADERLTSGTAEDLASRNFSPLNVLVLEYNGPIRPPRFGLTEAEIRHSRGLITKSEVRAATLHALRLPEQGVLWDIGGGSGSVSLEATALSPELAVYTVEKKAEELDNIRANIRTYGAYAIRLVAGEAPSALSGLPAPDRVFVGGSGGQLAAILQAAAEALAPEGRIVVNAVLESSRKCACESLSALGLQVTECSLAVCRRDESGREQTFNPISIITGTK